jgi:hypothetical protein
MPSKTGYLQRYLTIIQKVRKNKYISMNELINAVQNEIAFYNDDRIGVSESTIRRDLREIRNELFLDIKYSKAENGMVYLDFYASHRMTNDRHLRIYENGETKELLAYLEFFVVDDNGTGKRKYEEHNRKVRKMLIEKGFDKYTVNMSIQSGAVEEF